MHKGVLRDDMAKWPASRVRTVWAVTPKGQRWLITYVYQVGGILTADPVGSSCSTARGRGHARFLFALWPSPRVVDGRAQNEENDVDEFRDTPSWALLVANEHPAPISRSLKRDTVEH